MFSGRDLGRGLAGVRKVWRLLRRDRSIAERFDPVARCTVARLMRAADLKGARRGKRFVTTRPDAAAARPPDLVGRDFSAVAPNRLWIVDFTYAGIHQLHERLDECFPTVLALGLLGCDQERPRQTAQRQESRRWHLRPLRVLVGDR